MSMDSRNREAFSWQSSPRGTAPLKTARKFLGAVLVSVMLIGGEQVAMASEGAEGDADAHHRHHVGLLLGGAVRSEHGEIGAGFALGADYEFRLHRLVGVGALVEVAAGDIRDVIVIAPVSLHLWRGFKLVAAPGVEVPGHGGSEFLFRLGVAYLFPIDIFSIGPEFNVDIVDGHPTYVTGLAVGVGF